ncbi:alpha/beta fold hydrolase [Rubrivirga sp.]|uniref:alpha/beta fold hydrolase n=1 Tax=Rubrivirga sp. TaxID=1885344 RepID=UPI003B516E0F
MDPFDSFDMAVETLSVAAVIIAFIWSKGATRRRLIDQGMLNEGYALALDAEARAARWTALRWGLVLAGFGAALVVSGALGLDGQGAAPWGLAALGAALGYVAYFFASARLSLDVPGRALAAAVAVGLAALAGPAQAQPVYPALASEQWTSTADDGHRTYVYEVGRAQAAGDTVVVLHGGWGAEHSYLVDALLPLADRTRFVLYDQRGSLRSPAPDSTITLGRLVADLDALRDDLGLDRVTLVAHSMGNHLAYAYLAARPERVRGLVLVGPVLPAAFEQTGPGTEFLADVWPDADSAAVSQAYIDGLIAPTLRGLRRLVDEGLMPERFADVTAEQVMSGAIDAEFQAARRALSARDRSRAWRVEFAAVNTCDGSNWRQMQGGGVFYNGAVASAVLSDSTLDAQVAAFWPTLQRFEGPVRAIIGTCDYVDPGPIVWPRVVGRLPDATLAVVEGAGHSLWMDRPAAFADALRSALDDATR